MILKKLNLVAEDLLLFLLVHLLEVFSLLSDIVLVFKLQLLRFVLHHALTEAINGLAKVSDRFVLICSLLLQAQDLLVCCLDVDSLFLASELVL